MSRKPSPLEIEVRRRLLISGLPNDALAAVMSYLEVERFLKSDPAVTVKEQTAEAVAAGQRQFEVLKLDRSGRGVTTSGVTPGNGQKGESRATVPVSWLAQRLLLIELSHHPRVRDWRRKHLGRKGQTLTWDEADQWVINNTKPRGEESKSWIYWSIPGDSLERTVTPDGPMASLLDLSKFLSDETGWHDRDAMMWVLMAKPPPIRSASIRVRLRRYDLAPTVIMEASVLMSDREVARHFRNARSDWVARRPAPGRKVVDMTNFRLDNPDLTWPECWQRWNVDHPASQYSDPASMKRSYFGLKRSLRQLREAKPQARRRRRRPAKEAGMSTRKTRRKGDSQ